MEELHHAFTDTVQMIPFLFVAYLIIEYIEKYSSEKMERLMTGFGRLGPLGGAVLGCVPQCGFSAAAANLYSTGVITMGTLVAVFVSTSDEALPLLFSSPGNSKIIIKLITVKLVIAAVAGFAIDFIFKSRPNAAEGKLHKKHAHCCHDKKGVGAIVTAAAKHTLETYIFVFVISLALGLSMDWLGDERISALFMTNTVFQPFVAALIGFIPNCASSVLLTKLFIEGTISFGSVVAGLCTGAGVGLAVLFKENRPLKDNFKIMGLTYIAAVIAGLVL